MRGIEPGMAWTHLIPGFILAGIGAGLVNVPLAQTAVGVVEPARAGMASGINATFRQVGIATGVAALGAIFSHHVVRRRARPGGADGLVDGLNAILLVGGILALTRRGPDADPDPPAGLRDRRRATRPNPPPRSTRQR